MRSITLRAAAMPNVLFARRLRMMSHNIRKLKSENLYFYERVIESQTASRCTVNGKQLVVLGSYNYLGLTHHPEVISASQSAVDEYGAGTHGTRITLGTTAAHRKLAQTISAWIGTEDTLVVSSGLSANISVLAALATPDDTIFFGTVNHASLHDGCRLSGARLVEFTHNDLDDLKSKLAVASEGLKYVVVDSVFSVDGDIVNLPKVRQLCNEYEAVLVVDEAHYIGVLGQQGTGITSRFNMPSDAIDVRIGVLSKAIPGVGGFITGSHQLVESLKATNHAFIFSGALPASVVAGAEAAINVLQREDCNLTQRLDANRKHWCDRLLQNGFNLGTAGTTPIVPVMCPTSQIALEIVKGCIEDGVLLVAAIYPVVAVNRPRLRTTVTASHTLADLDFAASVIAENARRVGLLNN
jgi:8-amino-7-oxononanoate synthase